MWLALSIAEAAARLGVDQTTIRRRLKNGSLRGRREPTPQGYRWLVELNDSDDGLTDERADREAPARDRRDTGQVPELIAAVAEMSRSIEAMRAAVLRGPDASTTPAEQAAAIPPMRVTGVQRSAWSGTGSAEGLASQDPSHSGVMSLVQHAPPLAVATEAGTAGTHVTAHAPLADGAGDADDSPLGRAVRDYRDTTLRIEWLRGEIALAQEHAAAAANFIAMYQCYAADLYRSP